MKAMKILMSAMEVRGRLTMKKVSSRLKGMRMKGFFKKMGHVDRMTLHNAKWSLDMKAHSLNMNTCDKNILHSRNIFHMKTSQNRNIYNARLKIMHLHGSIILSSVNILSLCFMRQIFIMKTHTAPPSSQEMQCKLGNKLGIRKTTLKLMQWFMISWLWFPSWVELCVDCKAVVVRTCCCSVEPIGPLKATRARGENSMEGVLDVFRVDFLIVLIHKVKVMNIQKCSVMTTVNHSWILLTMVIGKTNINVMMTLLVQRQDQNVLKVVVVRFCPMPL
jgi:hypothetical protein